MRNSKVGAEPISTMVRHVCYRGGTYTLLRYLSAWEQVRSMRSFFLSESKFPRMYRDQKPEAGSIAVTAGPSKLP